MNTLQNGDFARNIFETDDEAEREEILRLRLEVYGIIVDTVAEELGLVADTSGESRQQRLQRMLVGSVLQDAQAIQNQ